MLGHGHITGDIALTSHVPHLDGHALIAVPRRHGCTDTRAAADDDRRTVLVVHGLRL
jgi:hypothetical protein